MNKDDILNKFPSLEYINEFKKMNNIERKFFNAYNIASKLNKNKEYISQKLEKVKLCEKKAYLNVIDGNKVDIFGCIFNPVEGKLYKYFNDFNIKSIPVNLSLKRYYFSNVRENINGLNAGLIGKGWVLEYETYCNYKNDYIEIFYYNGTKDIFYKENNKFINKNTMSLNNILSEDTNKMEFILSKEKILYIYSFDGRLKKISDLYNNFIEIKYINDSKFIAEIASSYEMKLKFNYIDNKISSVNDNINRTVKYYYKNDFLSMVQYQNGGKYKFNYDEKSDKLNCIIDANGNIEFSAEYDRYGKPIKMYDIENNYAEIIYSDVKKQIIINRNRGKVIYSFNNNKFIEKAEDEKIGSFKYRYDENNNLVSRINIFGKETVYKYDGFNRVIFKKSHNQVETKYFYNSENYLSKIYISNGYQKLLSYNKNGSLIEKRIKIDRGIYSVEKYNYDSLGRIVEKILPDKNKISYEYRNKFNVLPNMIIYPNQFKVIKEYDSVLRLIKEIEGKEIKEYKYNNIDLKIQTTYNDGSNDFRLYDLMGNLKEIILPEENKNSKLNNTPVHKYKYIYDEKNVLEKVICPDGKIFIKEKKIYKEKKIKQIQKRNFIGKPIEKKIPLKINANKDILYKSESYIYNKNLNITEKKIGIDYVCENEYPNKFYTLKYDYDSNGNVNNVLYSNISYKKFLYKEKNKLCKTITAINEEHNYNVLYEYNNKGLLYKITELLELKDTNLEKNNIRDLSYLKLETIFHYNENGSLILIKLPDNNILKINYDLNGDMINNSESWFLKQCCKNELTLFNSHIYEYEKKYDEKLIYSYDIGNRVEKIYNKIDKNILVSYDYDCLNNIIALTDKNGITKFIYDKFLNIIKIIYPDNRYEIFEHDYIYNVSKYINKNGVIIDYKFNSINKLKYILIDKNKITYKYNSSGNISNKIKTIV